MIGEVQRKEKDRAAEQQGEGEREGERAWDTGMLSELLLEREHHRVTSPK